jgi:hypothetical protein
MTERPLSHREEEDIKDCYWAVNQNVSGETGIDKYQAMLDFYMTICPVQFQAIVADMASYGEEEADFI